MSYGSADCSVVGGRWTLGLILRATLNGGRTFMFQFVISTLHVAATRNTEYGILFCAINNTRQHKLMCQNSNLKILFVEVFGDYAS